MAVIRKTSALLVTILAVLVLSSCTEKSAVAPSEQRRATVYMQDDTQVAGTVVASSASEITIAGDDSITRTIPMAKVKSVEYRDVPVTQSQAAGRGESASGSFAKRAEPAGQAAPLAKSLDLPAGTEISVRSTETIDSSTAVEGQAYAAEVPKDVLDASSAIVIPRGSDAQLVIVSASKGGRIQGAADLVLSLKSVSLGGRRYSVDAADMQQRGKTGLGANKRTAEYTGGGAAVGAIIGAIAGGGKGAAIGAGAGAGAGALTQILTKGKSIRVPAESVLTFKLDKPLRIAAQ
jgi:hypothetical protein